MPQNVFFKARSGYDIYNGVAVFNPVTSPSDPTTHMVIPSDSNQYDQYASGDALNLYMNLSDRFDVPPSGWSE